MPYLNDKNQRRVNGALFILFCFCLSISVSNGALAETLNLQTDTTWRAIGPNGDDSGGSIGSKGLVWESANVGWNSSLSYDDSDSAGWKFAITATHTQHPIIRFWVDSTVGAGASPAYFRKEFFIPGVPTSGLLDIFVDDDLIVYINGSQAFGEGNGLATFRDDIDVSAFLVPGNNLIAIKAHDAQGDQALTTNLDIVYTATAVPEPSSIALWLSGLVGIVFCRIMRKRRGAT